MTQIFLVGCCALLATKVQNKSDAAKVFWKIYAILWPRDEKTHCPTLSRAVSEAAASVRFFYSSV